MTSDNRNMRKFILKIFLFTLICSSAFAKKPLYQLPESLPAKDSKSKGEILVGTDNGLYKVQENGSAYNLWNQSKITHITKTSAKWFFVTDNGIISSSDLVNFTDSSKGLPVLTIKEYDGTNKTFRKQVHPLKDLAVDPVDENYMVTATKDAVYLSTDAGQNWKSIGSASSYSAGMKAVSIGHMPLYTDGKISGSEVVVFLSHPIYGFSYYRAQAANPAWVDVSAGFAIKETLKQVDEIADFACLARTSEDGIKYCDLYASQSFIPKLYKFNWQTKRAECLYTVDDDLDTLDSLWAAGDNLIFETMGKVNAFSLNESKLITLPDPEYTSWRKLVNSTPSTVNAAYVPAGFTGLGSDINLNEMWMLEPENVITDYGDKASDRKAIYLSPYYLISDAGRAKYKNIILKNNLNALVVDMKDDYGLLRFKNPQDPLLKEKGYLSSYTVDLDKMIPEFKKDNIYLIARIVVFKDKHLSTYSGGKYAVWNSKTNAPWVGTKSDGSLYDENWVDPYSEEVWEYNIHIARELIDRGFDEIQFDYIRFPTDGTNIGNSTFRWRDAGMDKESALVSFLSYARKNIEAPIGIDIYGANGWYRTGARTGQDVELMKDYVDVICPMFYPSHFEQNFLEYAPLAERPYRIYFYGSYRNTVIGHNRIIVRPWVQAFYLGVRYDRTWYNTDYVKREVYGVRDGLNRGYMYWNNSGRYDDIFPDPAPDQKSPWYDDEGAKQKRLPAFSSGQANLSAFKPLYSGSFAEYQKNLSKEMISVLDSVRQDEVLDEEGTASDKKNKKAKFTKVSPFAPKLVFNK